MKINWFDEIYRVWNFDEIDYTKMKDFDEIMINKSEKKESYDYGCVVDDDHDVEELRKK